MSLSSDLERKSSSEALEELPPIFCTFGEDQLQLMQDPCTNEWVHFSAGETYMGSVPVIAQPGLGAQLSPDPLDLLQCRSSAGGGNPTMCTCGASSRDRVNC